MPRNFSRGMFLLIALLVTFINLKFCDFYSSIADGTLVDSATFGLEE